MYEPITIQSGVEMVRAWLSQFPVQSVQDPASGADGVEVVFSDDDAMLFEKAVLPDRLRDFLLDVRLLRKVPLCYLVPDEALLPPESIRFFSVDKTWTDRVVDGVFSAANTGTTDFAFKWKLLRLVRDALDGELNTLSGVPDTTWDAGEDPITGMLIRSELVRRWPDMIVEAWATGSTTRPLPVLRSEPVSRDIYIALFAGRPQRLHIREPFTGVRFGVEPKDPTKPELGYEVDRRDQQGEYVANQEVGITLKARRVIDIDKLATDVAGGSSMVALHLEQRPYVQVFKNTVDEPRGSIDIPDGMTKALRGGRFTMDLSALNARLVQAREMEAP